MAYTGKKPDFEEVVLDDTSDASTPAPSGKKKLRLKDGSLLIVDDAGEETAAGGSGGGSSLSYFV